LEITDAPLKLRITTALEIKQTENVKCFDYLENRTHLLIRRIKHILKLSLKSKSLSEEAYHTAKSILLNTVTLYSRSLINNGLTLDNLKDDIAKPFAMNFRTLNDMKAIGVFCICKLDIKVIENFDKLDNDLTRFGQKMAKKDYEQ
jgi:hypothetical protein